MFIKGHLIGGIIFTLILVYSLNIGWFAASIVFLSSILIDVDHYIYYILKTKDLNIKRSYNWFIKKVEKWEKINQQELSKYKIDIMAFHGIEFISILAILSFINSGFIWILTGVTFHLALDHIGLSYKKYPIYAKISPIYTYFTNKKKQELS